MADPLGSDTVQICHSDVFHEVARRASVKVIKIAQAEGSSNFFRVWMELGIMVSDIMKIEKSLRGLSVKGLKSTCRSNAFIIRESYLSTTSHDQTRVPTHAKKSQKQ